MALARKCDRCGMLYMPELIKDDDGNGFNSIVLTTELGQIIDLCPREYRLQERKNE